MSIKLSLLMISQNADHIIERSLGSARLLADEIVIIDNCSSDKTVEIAKKYGAKVFVHKEEDLGKQRAYGLAKVSYDWVLTLDADERVSKELSIEIMNLKNSNFQYPISSEIQNPKAQKKKYVTSYRLQVTGYYIPFQNHFLGKPIRYGGESYKMLRLFRKDAVSIRPALVHEHYEVRYGRTGVLKHKIYHYSYHSLRQIARKFTDYAIREARQKAAKGEKTSLRKVILYPVHMFWARFVEDEGYKDGIFRIPLDLGFAYMELITYLLLWIYGWRNSKFKIQNAKLH